MSRSLRRGSLAAVAALAIASLSACATGNNAETLEVKPDNASVSLGDTLTLNNIVVVTGDESSGQHTGPANVTVNISNTGSAPATLKSITVAGGAATFTDPAGASLGQVVIPAGGALLIGAEGAPSAHVASATLQVGGFAPTAFGFTEAGTVETQAAVYPNLGYYKGYGPQPAAAPTASVSPSAAASSATASPAAGVSPTATTPATAGAAATGSPSASGSPLAAGH
ncbi:DUF461 domain-containing protein [Kitasatospora sp. NBC_00315]|uniref:DUF461 domain-containing protein n=1 Tax=Kitasatospora sp. NBC_00315 TaxID=2975963 RepID=UPI0032552214